MTIPQKYKALIIDMDGVLWRGDVPIGNLPEIFARIQDLGLKVAFATNNGMRTPEQYVERFNRFGASVKTNQIITSSLTLAHLLNGRFPIGSRIFAIGEVGVMNALQEKGYNLVPLNKADEAQVVVFGADRQINFEKMCAATLLVRRGVPFYATNSDKTFPTPLGEIPGAGAWISVITTATGVFPIYAGKPAPDIFELAREHLGSTKDETLVVGDRLETDIAGGQAAGMPVCLVLSGVTSREEGEAWRPKVDILAQDLSKLV